MAADRNVPLLAARDLEVEVSEGRWLSGQRPRRLRILRGVDLELWPGEVLAVVGESGAGKSTLARVLVGAITPTRGALLLDGQDIGTLRGAALRQARRQFQMVFQDPAGALNPRLSIGASIAEPLHLHGVPGGGSPAARVAACLELVGLDPDLAQRRPHALSGGQRQRVCIARAIACEPRLIVADEALSALDPTVRERILVLFGELRQRIGLAQVFISHDLGVVRRIADRVAVLYFGQVVELAPASALFAAARHPYTQALLAAAPLPDPERERARAVRLLPGEPPSALAPPSGCAFHPRCDRAQARCRSEAPSLLADAAGHPVACHFPLNSPV